MTTNTDPKTIQFENPLGAISIKCRGNKVLVEFEGIMGPLSTDNPATIEALVDAFDYAAFVAWGKEWKELRKTK